MNASISIRKFKITIENVSIDETVRKVVDFELVFCKDHNLLMYSKFAMTSSSEKNLIVEDVSDSSDSDDSSENDLFDVKDSFDENF